MQLLESIIHIEDLPVDKFIHALSRLEMFTAHEKLDGAQLIVGIDDDGKLYTSREGKRNTAKRHYASSDWKKLADFNQFRAAHTALEMVRTEILQILKPGDQVEIEVIFGSQPNSTVYDTNGNSYIAFLRPLEETNESVIEELRTALNNKIVNIDVELVQSTDGSTIQNTNEKVNFKFITPALVDTKKIKELNLNPMIQKLKAFLQKKSVLGISNGELSTISLTSVPISKRAETKAARADVLATLQSEYKLPIKTALLDVLIKSLSGKLANKETDVEGVVLRDPESGEQLKVVDKDTFSAINQFNQSVRGSIQSALNTTDPRASLDSQGGLIGQLRADIAGALGNRELAKPSVARKLLSSIKGETPEDTVRKLASELGIQDFQATKRKILALMQETFKKLKEQLKQFNAEKDEYQLKLKNGTIVKLTAETIKRNLTAFAEVQTSLERQFNQIKETKNLDQLVAILYGSHAKTIHIKEELLNEKKGEIDVSEYERKDFFQLMNAYLGTVFMSMIIYHTGDTIGMKLLRDRKNYLMKRHTVDMSPLNHWGYAIWRHARPDVKKHMLKKANEEIGTCTKRIPIAWWKFLHMDFSFNKEVKVNWKDHQSTLTRLIELSGLRSRRLNKLLSGSINFPTLSFHEQQVFLKLLSVYVLQFVPRSRLYVQLKSIIKTQAFTKEKIMLENTLLKQIQSVLEDDSTMAGDIASVPTKLTSIIRQTGITKLHKRIEKRKRNPDIKDMLMKFKDPRKDKAE